MTEDPRPPPRTGRHVLAVALVAAGVLILSGLGLFVSIALGYRRSFTASLPPIEDMIEGLAVLSPFVLLALLLIGYGRRLLRKD